MYKRPTQFTTEYLDDQRDEFISVICTFDDEGIDEVLDSKHKRAIEVSAETLMELEIKANDYLTEHERTYTDGASCYADIQCKSRREG